MASRRIAVELYPAPPRRMEKAAELMFTGDMVTATAMELGMINGTPDTELIRHAMAMAERLASAPIGDCANQSCWKRVRKTITEAN
jgi:enoyl-CoA hydratase/carnithine racemase